MSKVKMVKAALLGSSSALGLNWIYDKKLLSNYAEKNPVLFIPIDHKLYKKAKTGFDVTSFDLSMQLLKIAQRKSTEDNLNVKYFRSDIRNVPLKGSFDLVLNMFTSFAYFTSDNENFSFIRTAYKLLNEKGYFIFDYLNKDYVINNLIPKSHKTIGDKKIIEERRINNNRVEKKIIIKSSSERKIFQESVLIYSKDEIIDGFNLCGFKVDKIFGDYIGSNYNSLTSERLLIFFVK